MLLSSMIIYFFMKSKLEEVLLYITIHKTMNSNNELFNIRIFFNGFNCESSKEDRNYGTLEQRRVITLLRIYSYVKGDNEWTPVAASDPHGNQASRSMYVLVCILYILFDARRHEW